MKAERKGTMPTQRTHMPKNTSPQVLGLWRVVCCTTVQRTKLKLVCHTIVVKGSFCQKCGQIMQNTSIALYGIALQYVCCHPCDELQFFTWGNTEWQEIQNSHSALTGSWWVNTGRIFNSSYCKQTYQQVSPWPILKAMPSSPLLKSYGASLWR